MKYHLMINSRIIDNRGKETSYKLFDQPTEDTFFYFTDDVAGFLGPAQGRPSAHHRPLHVHERPTIQADPQRADGRLDTRNQISAASGQRLLRVSSIHDAAHESHSISGCDR